MVQGYLLSINIFDFILFEVRKAFPSTVSDRSGIILQHTQTYTHTHRCTHKHRCGGQRKRKKKREWKRKSGRNGIKCMDKCGNMHEYEKIMWESEWVTRNMRNITKSQALNI